MGGWMDEQMMWMGGGWMMMDKWIDGYRIDG